MQAELERDATSVGKVNNWNGMPLRAGTELERAGTKSKSTLGWAPTATSDAHSRLRSLITSAFPEYTIRWQDSKKCSLSRQEFEDKCCCCCIEYQDSETFHFEISISGSTLAAKNMYKVRGSTEGTSAADGRQAQEHTRVTSLVTQICAEWQREKHSPISSQATAPEQHQMIAPVAPCVLITDELQKLAALKGQGVLTQAEFDEQKSRLLQASRVTARAPLLQ